MRKLLILLLIFCCVSPQLIAQKIVEGRVFDAETNKPLSGVLIFAKNTVKSALTDPSGNYRIIIPEKANILIFNFRGYARQEVSIKDISHVEVGLRSFSSRETENIVVIGSRDQTRTKGDSYVAVDIIPVRDVMNQTGYVELTQILHYFSPSFNANKQSGCDLADHVEPVSLRGLGPDQILFLLNGKRYITSAIINVFGTRGRGNVNTDLNAIPASAIERIEVLRDGAAAQYGSDAVAGVVNIVLKSEKSGTSGSASYGVNNTGWGASLTYKDYGKIIPRTVDGGTVNANVTQSFKMGKGNMTLTGDYFSRAFTFRPNNDLAFQDLNYRQKFGDAQQKSKSLYFNGKLPIGKNEIYTFGGYQTRQTDSYIWTIPTDDSSRNVYEIYPNGYNPHLLTDIQNLSLVIGDRIKIGAWNADFSGNYGVNHVSINTNNTLNPSLLSKSRTTFYNGGYNVGQYSANADVNRKYAKILNGLNVAFGGEYRRSNYKIVAGEDASWKNYMPKPLILLQPNGSYDTIKKVGTSQGFPGVSIKDALNEYRTNIGFYADAELDISPQLLTAGAIRYENYSDFGRALGGKLAIRYKPTPQYSMRFSAQTGFRAPSLAQIHFQSTINDVDDLGVNYERIVANSKSELTKKIGIPNLTVEKSINLGLGFNYNPNQMWLFSADAYYIGVNNRIILTGYFDQDDEKIGEDLKKLNVRYAQFYINALNTETKGVDLSATFKTNIKNSKLNMTFVGNFNKMTTPVIKTTDNFKGKEGQLISRRELQFITSAAPASKFHYNLNYMFKKSNFNLNFTYFSKLEIVPLSEITTFNNIYSPRLVTDVSYGLKLNKSCSLMIGVNNLFDVYPSIQRTDITDSGGQWEGVQNGNAGAFFFSRFSFSF